MRAAGNVDAATALLYNIRRFPLLSFLLTLSELWNIYSSADRVFAQRPSLPFYLYAFFSPHFLPSRFASASVCFCSSAHIVTQAPPLPRATCAASPRPLPPLPLPRRPCTWHWRSSSPSLPQPLPLLLLLIAAPVRPPCTQGRRTQATARRKRNAEGRVSRYP